MEKSEHHSVASARLQGLERSWTSITVGRWEGCNAWNKEESVCAFAYTWTKLQKCPPAMIHSDEDGVTLKILFMRKEEAHLKFL